MVIVVRPQRNIVSPWSRGQTGPAVSSGRVNAKQLGQDRGWHVGSQLVKGGESVWAGAHAMALQPPAQGLRTNGLIWIGADEEPSAVDNRLCLSSHGAGLLNQVPRHVTEGIGELDADSSQPHGHAGWFTVDVVDGESGNASEWLRVDNHEGPGQPVGRRNAWLGDETTRDGPTLVAEHRRNQCRTGHRDIDDRHHVPSGGPGDEGAHVLRPSGRMVVQPLLEIALRTRGEGVFASQEPRSEVSRDSQPDPCAVARGIMQESALTLDAERTEELPACVRAQDPRMLGVVDGRKLTIAPSLQGGKHRIADRERTGGH